MMDRIWNAVGCSRLVLLLLLSLHAGPILAHPISSLLGTDCTQLKRFNPEAVSGLYWIKPAGVHKPFMVRCKMRRDGGWTVFQRRTGGALSFRRNWAEYKNGFGDLRKDHWLGLEKLWAITKGQGSQWLLRVELWDFESRFAFAEYSDFRLANKSQAYRLSVGAYCGTAGDAIRGIDPGYGALPGMDQNGYGFSTLDRDNDGCSPCIFGDIATDDCSSEEGGGGWWYSQCGQASLHGDWHPGNNNRGWASGIHWHTWKNPEPYSLRATRMMVKAVKYGKRAG